MVSRVYLIGAGLGNPDTLTGVAVRALDQSDLIIGAERIIEALEGFGAKKLCL
jgi:precorrin-6B methylase 1